MGVFMGGATDFKVGGTKQDSRAERSKKIFLYPHFYKCGGYKQANISRGIEYIEICCLVVALINIGRYAYGIMNQRETV